MERKLVVFLIYKIDFMAYLFDVKEYKGECSGTDESLI